MAFLLCFVILAGCTSKPSSKEIAAEKSKDQLTAFDDVKVENKEFGKFPVHIAANYSVMNGSTPTWLSKNNQWSKTYGSDSGYTFQYKDDLYIFGSRTWTLFKFHIPAVEATNLKQQLSPYFIDKLSDKEIILTNREGGDSTRQRVYSGEPWKLKKGIMIPWCWGTGWRDSQGHLWIASDNNNLDDNGDPKGGYIHLLSGNGRKLIKTFQTSAHNFSSNVKLANGEYLAMGFSKWVRVNPQEMTVKEVTPPIDTQKYQVNDVFQTDTMNVLTVTDKDIYPTDHLKIVFLNHHGKIVKQLEVHYPFYPDMAQLMDGDLYIASQISDSVRYGGVIARIDLNTGKVLAQRFIPLSSNKDLLFVGYALY